MPYDLLTNHCSYGEVVYSERMLSECDEDAVEACRMARVIDIHQAVENVSIHIYLRLPRDVQVKACGLLVSVL